MREEMRFKIGPFPEEATVKERLQLYEVNYKIY